MSYLDDFWDKRKAQKRLTVDEQKKADERSLHEQREKIINYKKFFGTEHGREVMLDLMNKFHILNPTPHSTHAVELARSEGQRDVVLYLLARANTSIEQLDKIIRGEFN